MYTAIAALLLRLIIYVLVYAGFVTGDGAEQLAHDPDLVMIVTALVVVGGGDFVWFVKRNFGDAAAAKIKEFLDFREP